MNNIVYDIINHRRKQENLRKKCIDNIIKENYTKIISQIAYYLWENGPKSIDSNYYWFEAESIFQENYGPTNPDALRYLINRQR